MLECVKLVKTDANGSKGEFFTAHFREIEEFVGDHALYGLGQGTRLYSVGKEPSVGDVFKGSVQTVDTTSYTFLGRDKLPVTTNKISVVIIGKETATDVASKKLAKSGGKVIVNGKAVENPYIKAPAAQQPAAKAEEPTVVETPIGG